MSKNSPANTVHTLENIEIEAKVLFESLDGMRQKETAAIELRKQLQKDIEYKQTELKEVAASLQEVDNYNYKEYTRQEQALREQIIKEEKELYNKVIQERIDTTNASLTEIAMDSQKYHDTIAAYEMLANLPEENPSKFLEEVKKKYEETEVG